jgi:hypothetical protein
MRELRRLHRQQSVAGDRSGLGFSQLPAAAASPILALAALVGFLSVCSAHPMGSDPNAEWFQGLKRLDGVLCCNMRDCRTTDRWRVEDGHYAVLIEDRWAVIEDEHILRNVSNPTGMAVECHVKNGAYIYVLCFVPPVGV